MPQVTITITMESENPPLLLRDVNTILVLHRLGQMHITAHWHEESGDTMQVNWQVKQADSTFDAET